MQNPQPKPRKETVSDYIQRGGQIRQCGRVTGDERRVIRPQGVSLGAGGFWVLPAGGCR